MSPTYAFFDVISSVPHMLLMLLCNAEMLGVKNKKTYVCSATLICGVIAYINNIGYIERGIRIFAALFLMTFFIYLFIKKNYFQTFVFCGLNYLISLLCESISFVICYFLIGKHIYIILENIFVSIIIKIGFLCTYYVMQRMLCMFWKKIMHEKKVYYVDMLVPIVVLQSIFCVVIMSPYLYGLKNIWFGILSFFCSIISAISDVIFFHYLGEIYRTDIEVAKEGHLKIQLDNQKKRIESLKEDISKADEVKKYLKARIEEAGELLENKNGEEVKCTLSNISETISLKLMYCDNRVVDAVISGKAKECDENNIILQTEVNISRETTVNNAELCVIFANLLDNAIRACKQYNESGQGYKASIRIAARERNGYLVIREENTFNGIVENRKEGFLSEHGLGLGIIEQIVEKYEGYLKTENEDGKFVTTVLIKE